MQALEEGARLSRPLEPQEAERVEVLRPEMSRLLRQHSLELGDRLSESLAAIEFIGDLEVIDDIEQRRRQGGLLGFLRLVLPRKKSEVACPPQLESAARRSQPLALLQVGQGLAQVLFLVGWARLGRGLGFRLGKNQQQPGTVLEDFGLLHIAEVRIEPGPSFLPRYHPIHAERGRNAGARRLEVGEEIHAGVQRAQELSLVAQVDIRREALARRPSVGFDAQLFLDRVQERLGGLFHGFQAGLAADGQQRLLQVESCGGPIASGDGDTGAVVELLPLLLQDRQPVFRQRVPLSLPRAAFSGDRDIQLGSQREVMPGDEEHHRDAGQHADRQQRHDGRPALGPFPGAFPARYRTGLNRLAVDETAQIVGQLTGRGKPALGLFLEALEANRLQVEWHPWFQVAGRDGLLLHDLSNGVDRIASPKRRPTDQ